MVRVTSEESLISRKVVQYHKLTAISGKKGKSQVSFRLLLASSLALRVYQSTSSRVMEDRKIENTKIFVCIFIFLKSECLYNKFTVEERILQHLKFYKVYISKQVLIKSTQN